MNRMPSRMLTMLAPISLLLFIATIILWIRSYSGSDAIIRHQVIFADINHSLSHVYELQFTLDQLRLISGDHHLFLRGKMTVKPSPATWSYFRYGPNHVNWNSAAPRNLWNRLGFNS